MAKKILSYNNDGTLGEIPKSGSEHAAYFEDTGRSLYIGNLSISAVTTSLNTGILYTDGTGKLQTVSTASATSGQYLQWDNITSTYKFANATGNATGDFVDGSDLSGTLSSPQVLNISNVNTGTLSAKYGGTGVTSFTSGGLVVRDGSDTLKFLLPDAGFSVMRSTGSHWYAGGAGQTAPTSSVQLFTSPGTWTKPSGHQKALLAVVGGGGGGGAGRPGALPGGAGGSAGGVYINEEDVSKITSLGIQIGGGGTGGEVTPAFTSGLGGGTSYVSASSFYREAIGGVGGAVGNTAAPAPAASAARYKSIFGKLYLDGAGGAGGAAGANGSAGGASIFSGGGGGGGGGSPAVPTRGDGGLGGAGLSNTFINNITASSNNTGSLPQNRALFGIPSLIFAAGGGGGGAIGATAYSSSLGLSGSGGGGGSGNIQVGAAGGNGYVLIVSW
jgi:hypothetical protein